MVTILSGICTSLGLSWLFTSGALRHMRYIRLPPSPGLRKWTITGGGMLAFHLWLCYHSYPSGRHAAHALVFHDVDIGIEPEPATRHKLYLAASQRIV